MENLNSYFKFLLFIVLSFAILFVLNVSITSIYMRLLQQSSTTLAISSVVTALLFMVFGTIAFGWLAFIVRKFNAFGRTGVFIIVPILFLYSLNAVRRIYTEWHIEYGYDQENLYYKIALYSVCFLILFMTLKISTILSHN